MLKKEAEEKMELGGVKKEEEMEQERPKRAHFDYDGHPLSGSDSDPYFLHIDQLFPNPFGPIPDEFILGEGGEGLVYRATYIGLHVAVKRLRRSNSKEPEIMKKLHHTNVSRLIAYQSGIVVMELAENSLHDRLKDHTKYPDLKWDFRLSVALSVSRGLRYLHSQDRPVIHRDLKSPNIMFRKDGSVFLTDFGFAKVQVSGDSYGTKILSLKWASPEMLDEKAITTPKVDIYGIGNILYELLTRETPFAKVHVFQVIKEIQIGNRPMIPPEEECPSTIGCPIGYLELMKDCWQQKPERRPTLQQIISRLSQMYAVYEAEALGAQLKEAQQKFEADKKQWEKEKEELQLEIGNRDQIILETKQMLQEENAKREQLALESKKMLQEENAKREQLAMETKKILQEENAKREQLALENKKMLQDESEKRQQLVVDYESQLKRVQQENEHQKLELNKQKLKFESELKEAQQKSEAESKQAHQKFESELTQAHKKFEYQLKQYQQENENQKLELKKQKLKAESELKEAQQKFVYDMKQAQQKAQQEFVRLQSELSRLNQHNSKVDGELKQAQQEKLDLKLEFSKFKGDTSQLVLQLTQAKLKAEAEQNQTLQKFESELKEAQRKAELEQKQTLQKFESELKEAQRKFESELKEAQRKFESELKEAQRKFESELKEAQRKFESELKEAQREKEKLEIERKHALKSASDAKALMQQAQLEKEEIKDKFDQQQRRISELEEELQTQKLPFEPQDEIKVQIPSASSLRFDESISSDKTKIKWNPAPAPYHINSIPYHIFSSPPGGCPRGIVRHRTRVLLCDETQNLLNTYTPMGTLIEEKSTSDLRGPCGIDIFLSVIYVIDQTRLVVFNLKKQKLNSWPLPYDNGGRGIKVDGEKIYLTIYKRHNIFVWSQNVIKATWGKKSFFDDAPGTGKEEFNQPYGLTCDETFLYVCDNKNNRVQVLDKEKGTVNSIWGEKGTEGEFKLPESIFLSRETKIEGDMITSPLIYVGDEMSVQVRTRDGKLLQRIGGKKKGSEAGQFYYVTGLCVVKDELYVSDMGRRVQVFRQKPYDSS